MLVYASGQLQAFFRVLRDTDSWAVAMMTATGADELDELSPVEWVRADRNVESLLDFANVLPSEWA